MPQTSTTTEAQPPTPSLQDDDLELDTPAPVFAVRAFKQALFGTPAPKVRPPRKPTSNTIAGSPSKRPPGILLTPGTGSNSRRKTVSFDGHGNAVRPTPKGPGAFPSPWEPKDAAPVPAKAMAKDDAKLRSQKLHQDLFSSKANAKEDMAKQIENRSRTRVTTSTVTEAPRRKRDVPAKSDPSALTIDTFAPGETKPKPTSTQEDTTTTLTSPHSRSGRFWKSQYDTFSANSTLELRKLLKKEQIAKKYAKQKDSAALKLEEALRLEQRKVAELEREVEEYREMIRGFEEKKGKSERDGGSNGKERKMEVEKESLRAHLAREMGLEREVGALKEANDGLTKENVTLKKELESKQKHTTKEQLEPKRINTTQEQRGPSQSQKPTFQRQSLPSCEVDIWADAALGAIASKEKPAEHSTPRPLRRPLSTSNANAGPTISTTAQPLKPTTSLKENVSPMHAANSAAPDKLAAAVTSHAPLQTRPNGSTSVSTTTTSNAGGAALTDERKEAARLRLEMKRRSRVAGRSEVAAS